MSLITRCPACETMFKVVPDQLRISEGWVRCGQCDEIFDASLHLLEISPERAEMPAVGHEALAAQLDETVSSDATAQPVAVEPVVVDPDASRQGSPDELPMQQEPLVPDAADAAAEWSSPESILPVPLTASSPEQVVIADPDDSEFDDPELDDLDPDDSVSDHSAELSDVSFLRERQAASFWHKPLRRATLVFLSLALLLGLAGQIVFHERDRIAASEPRVKPWLLAICGLLNCTLSPLRRIESIVIESSSFVKIRGDSYRLNFTLKNTAATALAVPGIELTLTDSLDQPIVRRVLLPSELGVKSDTMAAGFEWPASVAMAVKTGGAADRVAGYRLLAFYP